MRKQWLVLLALLLGTLAGCGQDQITADDIVKRVQETIKATDDLHAVLELDMRSPEKSASGKLELWAKRTGADAEGLPTGKVRMDVLESSKARLADLMLVSDGEQGWLHVPAENKVFTGNIDELKELHRRRHGQAPTDPLAATEQLRKIVERGLEAFDVELMGEEAIAGQPAYKVKLTPKPETQEQLRIGHLVSLTAWIDQERSLPLKLVADAGTFGRAQVTAEMLETNTGLSDDLFTFTPPAGAEVIDVVEKIRESRPQPTTLGEARQSVDFPLLEAAELPEDVRLVSVQLINTGDDGPLVAQVYAGRDIEFSLIQSAGELPERAGKGRLGPRHAEGREVQVRGSQGRLVESQGRRAMTLLSWEESGIHIAIAGRVSGEQALEIAAGLQ